MKLRAGKLTPGSTLEWSPGSVHGLNIGAETFVIWEIGVRIKISIPKRELGRSTGCGQRGKYQSSQQLGWMD